MTDTPTKPGGTDDAGVEQRKEERERIGDYPQYDGLTRGTVIEYDDWQWGVVTEIDEDYEPAKVGFVLVDELNDAVVRGLESAWGCAEHFDEVSIYRWSEHEYWTDIKYITENDIWEVLGPLHPDERGVEA